MTLRRLSAGLVVLALVGAGVALYFAPSRPQAEIRRARALLPPPPPGAQEVGHSVETSDVNSCDESLVCAEIPPGQASTYYVVFRYRVPRRVRPRDVATWYVRRMRGWTAAGEIAAGSLSFQRGRTFISVDAQELVVPSPPGAREFLVSVYPSV
jgi:hypothetical protein